MGLLDDTNVLGDSNRGIINFQEEGSILIVTTYFDAGSITNLLATH